MKRLVQITLAALLVMGLTLTTFAQDGTIDASADVLTTLEFTNSTVLDFGNISSGSGTTVSTGSGGRIDLTASNGSDVSVTIDWPTITDESAPGLTTDSDDDLPVNFTYATDPDETTSNPANNTGDSDTDGISTTINFATFDGGTTGNVVGIFVGGSISDTDTGTPGNYTGTINLSAVYN